MSEDNAKLQALRERIDRLDEELQARISERASIAQEVARTKQAAGADNGYYRPEREAEVLRKVKARNAGPLSDEEMARLFREIMSACLALEEPLRIGFLGPEGTFTQAAALKHFGHSVQTASLATTDQVFRAVEAGECHYGVVPVENSTEGVVTHTLDLFINSPLTVCGEVELRIHHLLLGRAGGEAPTRVYSHQQSLGQCRAWLDANLGSVERVAVSSNAEAARRAAEEADAVAIAGEAAAEIYGLEVLARNIEDEPGNTTRFLVIGRQPVPPSGHDKTSLLLSTRNKPGALYAMLEPLSRHGVSMTRIESRPSRRAIWEYVFFVDIEGHCADPTVAAALQELESEAAMFRVLGSYPRSVL
ncbi:prephenate dehydratase [Ectothiorhodospiraceae bacterium 2226]|nr:prephenate dehydratase [Ectothiorhodospiraceae bacterium 2226]